MAEDASQSRTEPASPRRREEARNKGQVPYSTDLSNSFVLLMVLATMWLVSPMMGGLISRAMRSELMRPMWGRMRGASWTPGEVQRLMTSLAAHAATATVAVVAVSIAAALLAGVVQAGARITFQPLSPNWDKLNPAKGWGKLFSLRSAMRAGMSLGKAVVIGSLVWWVFKQEAPRWSQETSLAAAVTAVYYAGLRLALTVVGALFALGVLDYLFQWRKHEADLRMTRQELIEEHRNEEIDPMLRARIRRLLRDAAQNRSLADVPSATVVVTNPTHFAVALRYDRGEDEAPMIVAKGQGAFAQRIMDKAAEHNVPVLRRPPSPALYALGVVGEAIPEPLYRAVAEILAFVFAAAARAA